MAQSRISFASVDKFGISLALLLGLFVAAATFILTGAELSIFSSLLSTDARTYRAPFDYRGPWRHSDTRSNRFMDCKYREWRFLFRNCSYCQTDLEKINFTTDGLTSEFHKSRKQIHDYL
jgi:hypothetical protein